MRHFPYLTLFKPTLNSRINSSYALTASDYLILPRVSTTTSTRTLLTKASEVSSLKSIQRARVSNLLQLYSLNTSYSRLATRTSSSSSILMFIKFVLQRYPLASRHRFRLIPPLLSIPIALPPIRDLRTVLRAAPLQTPYDAFLCTLQRTILLYTLSRLRALVIYSLTLFLA